RGLKQRDDEFQINRMIFGYEHFVRICAQQALGQACTAAGYAIACARRQVLLVKLWELELPRSVRRPLRWLPLPGSSMSDIYEAGQLSRLIEEGQNFEVQPNDCTVPLVVQYPGFDGHSCAQCPL